MAIACPIAICISRSTTWSPSTRLPSRNVSWMTQGIRSPKTMKKVYVNVDEESLRARRGLVRQGSNFDQVEIMTILTKEDFSLRLPMTKRTHYPGTSMGNKIGDVVLDATDTMWSLTCAEKIVVHGKFRQAVGGLTKGEERTVFVHAIQFSLLTSPYSVVLCFVHSSR